MTGNSLALPLAALMMPMMASTRNTMPSSEKSVAMNMSFHEMAMRMFTKMM